MTTTTGDGQISKVDPVAKKATLDLRMRIITHKRLKEAAHQHPKAKTTLEHWHRVAETAVWRHFSDTRRTFSHADQVAVQSGGLVTVFNITNDFRLLTAIHYNRHVIYILQVLTHAEYDKDKWKKYL